MSDLVRLLWLLGAITMSANVVRGFITGSVGSQIGFVRRDENDYAFWLWMVISAGCAVGCLSAALFR